MGWLSDLLLQSFRSITEWFGWEGTLETTQFLSFPLGKAAPSAALDTPRDGEGGQCLWQWDFSTPVLQVGLESHELGILAVHSSDLHEKPWR